MPRKHPLKRPHRHETIHGLARRSLFAFLITFLVARLNVFLIMSHKIPNLYLFLKGTHVHHLNYGIILLALVAGYSVFRRPTGTAAEATAILYGLAMALTFDEFGMWLHLGGSYWQRTSVDAILVVAALIGLFAFARTIERLESRHFWAFLSLGLLLTLSTWVAVTLGDQWGDRFGEALRALEDSSSP